MQTWRINVLVSSLKRTLFRFYTIHLHERKGQRSSKKYPHRIAKNSMVVPVCRQQQRGMWRGGVSIGTLLDTEGLRTCRQLRPRGRRLTVGAALWNPAGGARRGGGHGFEGSNVFHSREMSLRIKRVKQLQLQVKA